jgi:hypothetical protein
VEVLSRVGLLAALALGAVRPGALTAQQALSVEDQVAIYTSVLQVEAALLGRDGPTLPFLLIPIPVRPGGDTVRMQPGVWARLSLDSAVVNALLRARVVDGLCWAVAENRCAGEQRGYGARLSQIEAFDDLAVAGVDVRVVLAERDNAQVPDRVFGHVWQFQRRNGRWTAVLPERRPPP